MALYGVYRIGSIIANSYKARHPKRGHFKTRQFRGLLDRAMGLDKNAWWVIYTPSDNKIVSGPWETKEEADYTAELLFGVLEQW